MEEIDRRRAERKFRPLPENLRRLRGTVGEGQAFARFYCLYKDVNGITRRISFSVKVNRRLRQSPRGLAFLIRATVKEMLDDKVPEHFDGQLLPNFLDLYYYPWNRVRRVLEYKANVEYRR